MYQPEALAQRRLVWFDLLRLLLMAAGAALADFAFFTTRQVGGVDARWYGYMQRGFTDQFGSGHVPLLIGQGPFAWNGGVHPFRSAPVFMLVGGFWKLATLGTAGMYAVEHLTAITSGIIGILGFYRLVTLLMPQRPWAATALALVYGFTPSWLATIYVSDAYMSYMAFAAMPLVLYGNARTLLVADGRGYVPLGAGLALLWMCHPPIALLTTLTTVVIQTLVVARNGFENWRQILTGALLFGVLAAYYFATMGELPQITDQTAARHGACWLLGMAAFAAGAGRCLFFKASWPWIFAVLAGMILVYWGSSAWLIWSVYALGFAAVGSIMLRVFRVVDRSTLAVPIMLVAAVAAAGAAEISLPAKYKPPDPSILATLHANTRDLASLVRPLPPGMNTAWTFQPGWAGEVALLLGVAALCSRRGWAEQVFAASALTLLVCVLDVPRVSDFLAGRFPQPFASISGMPLTLRVAPVLASFSLMAGVLWLAATIQGGKARPWIVGAMLTLAVCWSAYEATRFVRYGQSLTLPKVNTDRGLRTENAMLDRYAYDLLHIPDYYSNGIVDPAMESRLIGPDGAVIVGPKEMAKVAEERDARTIRLTTRDLASERWFDVAPRIAVPAGERLILDFVFDPRRNYQGFMIMVAEDAYREYHLPDSGQRLAFGVGRDRSSVISLWNSGPETAHYDIEVSREAGNDLRSNGDHFADVIVAKFDPSKLPIRLVSLDPYHAVVKAPRAGFLETFRVMLPGYQAFVDGVEVAPQMSPQTLVEVPVPAGVHDVVLRFVGSRRMWVTAAISALAWIVLLAIWVRRSFAALGS